MSTGRWDPSGVQRSNGTSTCAPRAPRRCAIFRRSWPAASNPAARDGTFTRAWRPRRPSSSPLRSHPSFVPRTQRVRSSPSMMSADRCASTSAAPSAGWTGVTETQKQVIGQALVAGHITVPSVLSDLAGTRGTLLGDSDAVAFRVLAPIGTTVLDDCPSPTPLAHFVPTP